jgi:undecaprenyl-diphosphatase
LTPLLRLHPRGVLVVSAACFVALAGAALLAGVFSLDLMVRDTLLAWASPGFVAVMRVVNLAGEWRFLLPGVVLLFAVFPRARRRWWIWAALMIAAPLLETTFKEIVARPRPEAASMGFPSGHATAAAAYFGAVVYLAGSLRRPLARGLVRAGALLAVLGVALARIVLRAHWPSDTLAGITLGLALASAAALAAALHVPEDGGR